MTEIGKDGTSGNQGIQANTVTADVLAVGTHATAHKQVAIGATPQDFLNAIAQLHSALNYLALPTSAEQVLSADIKELTAATTTPKPDNARIQSHLKGLSDKLKMVGIVMKDITELW